MVKDLYNSKNLFENWIKKVEKKKIPKISQINSDLVVRFIKDFHLGINISKQSKKGGRSYNTLNRTRDKIIKIISLLEKRKIKDITKVKEENLLKLFTDMREGKIKNRYGTAYKSAGDYAKNFKTFWHWYQRVMKKKGKIITDVTEDLDRRGEKPKFVYFTELEFEKLIKKASKDTKPILALAFDSGMRVTELMNIKVSDFLNDYSEVNIRDETSKTFGRRIKLKICSKYILNYVNSLGLTQDDYLSQKSSVMINKELRKLGQKYLSAKKTEFKNLTLYDFRHSSACFWLPRYKSESALKYRFGWKKSDMIHYYTEFLGMKDTITDDDMYMDITKTELEKRVALLEKTLQSKNKVEYGLCLRELAEMRK